MLVPSLASSFAGSLLLLPIVEAQSIVQILGASPRQAIDGFGCSVAFLADDIQRLPSSPRSAMLKLLFSPSSGAGFSIVRGRIAPSLADNHTFDLSSDDDEIGTRWFMTQAKSFGVTKFLASAWTPPVKFKIGGDPKYPQNGGMIINSAASFSGYADYLYNYVTDYSRDYGIDWYAISPQNEPEAEQPYESCVWEQADFVQFLGTYLGPRFQQNGVSTRILAPESVEWMEATIAPTLKNSTSRGAVQIVATHPYNAGDIGDDGGIHTSGYDYFAYTKKYNKQLWATEYSKKSADDTINESISLVTLVHKQLTVPESNAFLWWWCATDQSPDSEGLLIFDSSGKYFVTKRFWALSQFARFIRPGWVRIDATAEPISGVHVSAFKDSSATAKIAIVAINQNSVTTSVKFNLYDLRISKVAGYRTSKDLNLSHFGDFKVSQGSFTIGLPAQSITTFIGDTNSSTTAFAGSPAFITEFNSLAGSSGASGDLITKFNIGTIDPSGTGSDETALYRQTNTAEYIQYPITSAFTSFVLSIQRNAYEDGLSFAAVSSSGALSNLVAKKSKETQQTIDWVLYTYTITTVPVGTKHIRIRFSTIDHEWNPRLTRLVIK